MEKMPAVYILANTKNTTLYTGVTANLHERLWHHRNATVSSFTKKYRVKKLVWYETHGSMESAIIREKQIKKWKRAWKIRMILKDNPEWRDLTEKIG